MLAPQYYSVIFFNVILLIVLISAFKLYSIPNNVIKKSNSNAAAFLWLIIIVIFIGTRPVSGRYFTDMATYANDFNRYKNGADITRHKDLLWHQFMKWSSSTISIEFFFTLCAALYIAPLYKASKNWLPNNYALLFLMLTASFSFWGYGVNGIRNGIATSLILWSFSINKNNIVKYALMYIAIGIHSSSLIPIAGYLVSKLHKNPKSFLYGWILAIPLSVIGGGFWELLFSSIGFTDDRTSYLTDQSTASQFSSTGFRWDFVLYSATGVFVGYYTIIKKQFTDKLYIQLFNIYVTCNAFWILVIRASFSNRFAYLSWFMLAVIIFYPFLKKQFISNQNLALIVLAYFSFTYLLLFVLV